MVRMLGLEPSHPERAGSLRLRQTLQFWPGLRSVSRDVSHGGRGSEGFKLWYDREISVPAKDSLSRQPRAALSRTLAASISPAAV
eukprot:scaffold3616_cov124-Isochrysis_galbana.AAC.8